MAAGAAARCVTAPAFGEMEAAAKAALPALRQAAQERDPAVKHAAEEAIGKIRR